MRGGLIEMKSSVASFIWVGADSPLDPSDHSSNSVSSRFWSEYINDTPLLQSLSFYSSIDILADPIRCVSLILGMRC